MILRVRWCEAPATSATLEGSTCSIVVARGVRTSAGICKRGAPLTTPPVAAGAPAALAPAEVG